MVASLNGVIRAGLLEPTVRYGRAVHFLAAEVGFRFNADAL
jgi:hypothetical protein